MQSFCAFGELLRFAIEQRLRLLIAELGFDSLLGFLEGRSLGWLIVRHLQQSIAIGDTRQSRR